jgi:hypothetical protein
MQKQEKEIATKIIVSLFKIWPIIDDYYYSMSIV